MQVDQERIADAGNLGHLHVDCRGSIDVQPAIEDDPDDASGERRRPTPLDDGTLMGLFDTLLGRTKPVRANLDALFSLPSAAITFRCKPLGCCSPQAKHIG